MHCSMTKQHFIIVGFLLLSMGNALFPASGFSQERKEAERTNLVEASGQEVVRRPAPVPLVEEAIRELQPPRTAEQPPTVATAPAPQPAQEIASPPTAEAPPPAAAPAPPRTEEREYDPCSQHENDQEAYGRCRKCATAIYGNEITIETLRNSPYGRELMGCCMVGAVDMKDLLAGPDQHSQLAQECRCTTNPSALACMGCLAPQQVEYMSGCYEQLVPEQVETRARIKVSAEKIAQISFTEEASQELLNKKRVLEKEREGIEEPGKRTPQLTADTPLCGCEAPQAVEEPGICHRDFLRNVMSFPCLHPAQEADARKFIKSMIAGLSPRTEIRFNSLEYSPSSRSFDVTFTTTPSQCKQLRSTAFSRTRLDFAAREYAGVVKADAIPSVKRTEAPEPIEEPESCSVSVPECLCDAPPDIPTELTDGGTPADQPPATPEPTTPEPETPVVEELQDERLFACREGSAVAIDVETCELIWLGDKGEERCPEVPLELAIDPAMIELSQKVEGCERGEVSSLSGIVPNLLHYIKVWKGMIVPEGKRLDMPSPPIRAFQFAPSVDGERFATTTAIKPEHVTVEELAAETTVDDPVTVAGGPSQTPGKRNKLGVKIRVFPPLKLPKPNAPLGTGDNDSDGDGAGRPVIKMTGADASTAITDQVAPAYLLVATGSTGVAGGGCSLSAMRSFRPGPMLAWLFVAFIVVIESVRYRKKDR